jgi:hypothetical protein
LLAATATATGLKSDAITFPPFPKILPIPITRAPLPVPKSTLTLQIALKCEKKHLQISLIYNSV